MIILLSPAKNLNETGKFSSKKVSQPILTEQAQKLINNLSKQSAKKIAALMKLSPALADLNYDRYRSWATNHTESNSLPALAMFSGQVFFSMKAEELNQKQLDFAQEHLLILSGLYGVLRPLDLMQPYRLEMGSKLKIGRNNNLYQFWGSTITEKLNELNPKGESYINLASNEYFKAVKPKELNAKIITCEFKEFRDDKYKAIMTYAKAARGLMAKYIVANKLTKDEDVKGFDSDGYSFNQNESSDSVWTFTR